MATRRHRLRLRHGQELRTLLANRAGFLDTPFAIFDWSVKEAFTSNWREKATQRIRQVGQVTAICGHYSDTATGVAAARRSARDLGEPYFHPHGRATRTIKNPISARTNDKVYDGTRSNLKFLIGGAL